MKIGAEPEWLFEVLFIAHYCNGVVLYFTSKTAACHMRCEMVDTCTITIYWGEKWQLILRLLIIAFPVEILSIFKQRCQPPIAVVKK